MKKLLLLLTLCVLGTACKKETVYPDTIIIDHIAIYAGSEINITIIGPNASGSQKMVKGEFATFEHRYFESIDVKCVNQNGCFYIVDGYKYYKSELIVSKKI